MPWAGFGSFMTMTSMPSGIWLHWEENFLSSFLSMMSRLDSDSSRMVFTSSKGSSLSMGTSTPRPQVTAKYVTAHL